MKRHLLLTSILILNMSCGDNPKEQSNEIEYYENGTQYKKIVHLRTFDSVYYYYKNGNVFKKGEQLNEEQKRGKWFLYDKESNLREIREWFPFEGSYILNRVWHLNKKGDTIPWRTENSIYQQKEFIHDTVGRRASTLDIIYFNRDTIELNEPIRGFVEIFSNLIEQQPSNVRVRIAKENRNYNYDFSNEKEVDFYTFYDLAIDTLNRQWFKGAKFNDLVPFGFHYKTTGQKKLRGYYQQYFIGPTDLDDNGMKIDSVIGPRIYFEHKIVVVDSLKK